ncbi:serine hydrolase family protein [Pedobacter sp. HDW13]|nr:alpha/beta fold hydrolase [Pedobacter sp. HDW13]QIL39562.1 serine hydrolase family protein [Pedobacter sp. HDW13]
MVHYFIIPGLGNSGPNHWQTHFEKLGDHFTRINQQEWDAPSSLDWIETIDKALEDYDLSTVVLIGHSLGCTAIANWAKRYQKHVKGALLVAPAILMHRNILSQQLVLTMFHSIKLTLKR